MMPLKRSLLSSAALPALSAGLMAAAFGLAATAAWVPDRADAPERGLNPVAAAKAEAGPSGSAPSGTENPAPVTRLAASCNPCAPKAACSPCNPCAAKAPCSPCSPCNPCAAQNPCNPCAPGSGAMLVPTECAVPSLRQAAANPCAAAKPAQAAACSPCNPCAAKAACSPCNPCAVKNPCNPCAAADPCSPCNPCAASAHEVTVPDDEMLALYDCLKVHMRDAYANGGHWAADRWAGWEQFSTRGYRSETHGGRFVHNAANDIAADQYGRYEDVRRMPVGSTLAKPSFTVAADGQASIGPLFIMEKMTRGWNDETADWRYAMILPDGTTFGLTGGQNSAGMGFCHECHAAAEGSDMMFFLPEEVRR